MVLPSMFNYCFEKYGLNCAYLAFDVDMEHVAEGVAALRTFGVQGLSLIHILTLETLSGKELEMQTDMHDLSIYSVIYKNNAEANLLSELMKGCLLYTSRCV